MLIETTSTLDWKIRIKIDILYSLLRDYKMKQDKIVVEKTFFVQVVVSLLSTYAIASNLFNALWNIPVMVVLVFGVNAYFNMAVMVYKLKHKGIPKLSWCFKSSFKSRFY